MELTAEEREILAGKLGEAPRRALEYQVEVGRFWQAKRMVTVTNVHLMGDIEVMGDGGLEFLREEVRLGARCRVGATTNARCIDFAHCDQLGQDPAEVAKEREIIQCLRRMEVVTTDTCINYQTGYQPRLGEHVAWGDTGTVIYANSVLGARSNFESGPAALAAALTGRTPEYGFHLDDNRKGTFSVELHATLDDLADWGAVGKLVGESHQNYFAVPVFHGYRRTPSADELKHLGAALASYGSMAMFHFAGVTPEAPPDISLLREEAVVAEKDIAVLRDRDRVVVPDVELALVGVGPAKHRVPVVGVLVPTQPRHRVIGSDEDVALALRRPRDRRQRRRLVVDLVARLG